MNRPESNGGTKVPDELLAVFAAAVEEDMGALIVAIDDLGNKELERVLDAAQMIDSEAQDVWEQRRARGLA